MYERKKYMKNYNDAREINLVDMLWSICLKWRSIILWGIIIALIAGGLGYYNATKVIDIETIELKEDEEQDIEYYLAYKSLYETQEDYNDYAPLMTLDANDFYSNVLIYYVDNHYAVEYPVVDEKDNIASLIQAYKGSIKTEAMADDIASTLDMDVKSISYATEYIDLDNVYGDTVIHKSIDENNSFVITIYGDTKESCQQISDLVIATIANGQPAMVEQFGEHDITLVSQDLQKVADIDLATYQKKNIDNLTSYKVSLETKAEGLSRAAADYVNAVVKAEEEEEEESNLGTIVKYAIIGFILGMFLAFFIIALKYIISNRLRITDGFEKMFDVKLLGCLPNQSQGKKKIFRFIDNIFIKKINKNKRIIATEDSLSMIVSQIGLLAKKDNITDIFATGTTISELGEELAKELSKSLKEKDIDLSVGQSILSDASSLEKATNASGILLFEKANKAHYGDISRQLDTCERLNLKVVGAVVIE